MCNFFFLRIYTQYFQVCSWKFNVINEFQLLLFYFHNCHRLIALHITLTHLIGRILNNFLQQNFKPTAWSQRAVISLKSNALLNTITWSCKSSLLRQSERSESTSWLAKKVVDFSCMRDLGVLGSLCNQIQCKTHIHHHHNTKILLPRTIQQHEVKL